MPCASELMIKAALSLIPDPEITVLVGTLAPAPACFTHGRHH